MGVFEEEPTLSRIWLEGSIEGESERKIIEVFYEIPIDVAYLQIETVGGYVKLDWIRRWGKDNKGPKSLNISDLGNCKMASLDLMREGLIPFMFNTAAAVTKDKVFANRAFLMHPDPIFNQRLGNFISDLLNIYGVSNPVANPDARLSALSVLTA